MRSYFYKPTFYRHLHNLTVSGFYTRELDADDFAFLEQVKVKGIANGELPSTTAFLIEEQDYWHFPYAVDRAVERRHGPIPKMPRETPEQAQLRLARSSAWRARRAIAEYDNKIAQAELERERREWAKAKEVRKLREVISDAEWEAADPARKNKHFGKVVNRHYVPQWWLDEQHTVKAERAQQYRAKAAKNARIAVATRVEQAKEQEAVQAKAQEQMDARAREAAQAKAQEGVDARARAIERYEAQRKAEEARATLERLAREKKNPVLDADQLKQAILTLLRNTAPYVWTPQALMRSTGCTNDAFMMKCLREMMADGSLRKVPVPETQSA